LISLLILIALVLPLIPRSRLIPTTTTLTTLVCSVPIVLPLVLALVFVLVESHFAEFAQQSAHTTLLLGFSMTAAAAKSTKPAAAAMPTPAVATAVAAWHSHHGRSGEESA
jgi:hypothetical protein